MDRNHNEQAWNEETYDAWVERFGNPAEAAAKIGRNPEAKLHPIYNHFGDIAGKRVANLMGSNGFKAVALALLGADVTIVDISPGNEKYALELASAAGVKLHYIVSDVLKMPVEELTPRYDLVFAELGIVHYFTDLVPFMRVAAGLLKPTGRFVLRDFHPVSTKLLSSRGSTAKIRKHKVDGDYFDTSLEEMKVSYSKYLSADHSAAADPEVKKVYLRRWTLGEIVTAAAAAGLHIVLLQEEPNLSSQVFDKGIPKTFTLVADKL